MEQLAKLLLWQLLLQQSSVVNLYSVPADASNPESVVVSVSNISAVLGSQAVLPCKSYRMVWTQDRLNDRQRVVHWDVYSSYYGDNKVERLCDMYSAGDQRVYSSYNQGRIFMPQNAFADGNFSLVIKDVAESDEGVYSCNLHHHYCHLYETVKIQLDITKKGKEARQYWDGEKAVIVALQGSTVTLPCVNRNHIWTERHSEEEQQVVHWDRQPPGVPHDRADRLIDLYASGERRSYGPLFVRRKMNITDTAFAVGDFSLRIAELESADEGTYSCHLHHHYCGLHERRIYQVFVTEPVREKKVVNLTTHNTAPAVGWLAEMQTSQLTSNTLQKSWTIVRESYLQFCQNKCKIGLGKPFSLEPTSEQWIVPAAAPWSCQLLPLYPSVVRGHNVINVIIPESRIHFFQQLGYILATLLLFLVLLIIVVLITRKRRQRGYEYNVKKHGEKDVNLKEFTVDTTDLTQYKSEDIRLDYKNNILKEKAEQARSFPAKIIDLDKDFRKEYCK